ncbi:hypothetical protein FKR81_32095 [Lentzea tibetensis]|uniref:Uncharacterized protein n=1 Tax=Lentzea tibetensis TaxID=2591470 RepID=A0A563EKF3_9PSEU|nr:hypothetical protein [Lentzea tibetensis]TWP47361.1 hypothetical protein FKR81_32095 [Lentzea tibetensis]
MNDVWIRLNSGRAQFAQCGIGFGWAIWQPRYVPAPWPHDELKPDFAYYVCEDTDPGRRAITARVTVEAALPRTEVASAADAYRIVADHLFDDEFTIDQVTWWANDYNQIKAKAPWPQFVTAWRGLVEPVGPYVPDVGRFPSTCWRRADEIPLLRVG